MNLKTICMNKLVEQINNLPPLLKDQVVGQSTQTIKNEAKQDFVDKIQNYNSVIDDITDLIIDSKRTGKYWQRPNYTYNIDNDIYNSLVYIADNFVTKHYNEIVLFGTKKRYRNQYESDQQEENYDDDDDDEDY